MDPAVLNDPAIYPSEEVLASHLGSAMTVFTELFGRSRAQYPDFVETWKYYNDGKSWLLNVSRKKKTLFWLSIGKGWFRTTFYFNSKADDVVLNSALPNELKDRYRESAGKKFRGITLTLREAGDIEPFGELLGLKLSIRQ